MNQKLHSTIIGKGRPLIILHGFLGMSDNWKSLALKYAKQNLEVHLVDQRNHGRSFHSNEFNYDVLANDLYLYTKEHQIEEPIILGHSMGGKTAMQYAVTHANNLSKLLVADIAPKYYPPHHQQILDGLSRLNFETITSRSQADKELESTIHEIGIRQFLLKNLYWVEKGKLALRFNLDVLKDKMEEIGDTLSHNEIYQGPTLFLRGDRSEYISPADSDLILQHFPLANVENIKNAGHWLHAENPNQFFEKSMLFINQ